MPKTSTRPTRIEIDCSTGIQSVIELTDEEILAMEDAAAAALEARAIEEAEKAAKSAAREAILTKLGLTAEEAAILLG